MRPKHTPGPWKDIRVCNSIAIVPQVRPAWVKPRDVEDIASLDCCNEQYDAEANARLIAAAPDLLAALKTFLEVHDLIQVPGERTPIVYGKPTLDAARAAVDSAEGGAR